MGPYAGHIAGAAAAIALVTPDPRTDGRPLSVMCDLGGGRADDAARLGARDRFVPRDGVRP